VRSSDGIGIRSVSPIVFAQNLNNRVVAVASRNQIVSKLLDQSRADQTRPLSGAALIDQKRKVIDGSFGGILTVSHFDSLDSTISRNMLCRGATKFLQF